MANVRVVTAAQNAHVNAIRDLVDAGAGPGTVKIYTGAQPASANTAVGAQVLLGTLVLSDPSAPNGVNGLLTFNAIADDPVADNPGNAAWARIADSAGGTVFDCDVALSGATLNLSSVSVAAGDILRITSFTLQAPPS